jgi:citrate lyase subunit beta/citryl-CoA lyase
MGYFPPFLEKVNHVFLVPAMNSTPPLDCTPLLPTLAPCEHIAGNEKFIIKGFALQERYVNDNGRSLVDLTLDLEDGAPVGNEEPLRKLFTRLLNSQENTKKQAGIRIHPVDSPHCIRDLEVVLSEAGHNVSYVTIPRVRDAREVLWCIGLIRHFTKHLKLPSPISVHLLIETSEALGNLDKLAAIPEVSTLDFGLMDFISQLGGAVSSECMKSPGQFSNLLIKQVKSNIAIAALRANKIASHNVSVDFRNTQQTLEDARRARAEFGFMRMWSIHPDQISPIIEGMIPTKDEIAEAREILAKAAASEWGPIEHNGRLHDRASYRYYWGIISRAS